LRDVAPFLPQPKDYGFSGANIIKSRKILCFFGRLGQNDRLKISFRMKFHQKRKDKGQKNGLTKWVKGDKL